MVENAKAARLGEAIKDAGLSWSGAGLKIGLSAQAPTRWKDGKISEDSLEKLAKLTNYSFVYLLTGVGPKKPYVTPEVRQSAGTSQTDGEISRPTQLPKEQIHKESVGIRTPQQKDSAEPIEGAITMRMQRVPVVGTAQFGDEGYWDETQHPVGHGEGFIEFPTRDPNAYALRGSGNSMAPRFRHGEYVIIEPNTAIHAGDEVMVRLKSGRTMGKIFTYERDGMTYFESVNQDHAPISVPTQDIEKMHFVAGVAKRSLWRPAAD